MSAADSNNGFSVLDVLGRGELPDKNGCRDSCDFSPIRESSDSAVPVRREPPPDWLVWQIADSAFPSGGFAHSNGLEAAWQQGEITSCEQLAHFIRAHMAQLGRVALPFVNEAFHETRPLRELDFLCEAFLSNHVAKRASRSQGQAFLFAATHAFASPRVARLRAEVENHKLPGHLAPVFGAVLCALELSHSLCVRLFFFVNLRSLVASAVRLGIVGPLAAQALQSKLATEAERVGSQCAGLCVADAAQTCPLLDIWQGAHDRLYSRLFQT